MFTKKRQLIFAAFVITTLLLAMACQTSKSAQNTKNLMPAYPVSKTEIVQENINGYEISDPFRWMEKEGAADKWVEEQNKFSENYFDRQEFPGLEKRVTELFSIGFVSSPQVVGDRLFYSIRDHEKLEQPLLVMQTGETKKVLIDLNAIDESFKTSLDWYHPSYDGKLMAYGLSENGSEESVLYIMDTDSGEILGDIIPDTRHCSLSWLPDATGFYYTRYPAGERYNRTVYFHKLGDDPTNDKVIFDKKRNKSDWSSILLSPDGKQLLIAEHRGWANTDLYLYDTKLAKLKTLFIDLGMSIGGMDIEDGKIFALTNLKAENGRIVIIDPKNPQPDQWKTIVAEDQWPIEGFLFSKNRLVLQKLEDVATKIYVHDLQGKPLGQIKLETVGMVNSLSIDRESGKTAFIFTSFFHPTTLYLSDVSGDSFESQKEVSVKAEIDSKKYVVKQIKYPSYDGTFVNMFVVHKKGVQQNSLSPTLLYGYGGFQVNMSPYFSRRIMFWIERGGVYAVANIRGGGEYGEKWHKAGMKENKHQVFRDFEYAMRYLIKEKYTSPDKLVIEGGSNGGLLLGAMMTETPELFACAVASVGLYDMIRYHKFPPGELWIPEYGSADEETDTGYILGYSPYHQIIKGVKYPAFFGDTAESDSRVHWVHTAKFVAALQNATASKAPLLFYLERKAGHGAGKAKSAVTEEYINKFKFMFSIVGDPAAR